MEKKNSLTVKDVLIRTMKVNGMDYISITDIAKQRNPIEPKDVVKNWMRLKNTLEYLGLWEQLNNPSFKGVEFDPLLIDAGSNAFTMSPSRWVETTNAIGIITKTGAGGGTFAQRDIAKFNYHIHTDAIKQNLIPKKVTAQQISFIYANEADLLNVALFGITAKEWREQNPDLKGNIRDYASINELICLSNMENLNAVFINENLTQKERLIKLNQIAIQQMSILHKHETQQIVKK